MGNATLGVICGNRDFFPDHLVSEARTDLVSLAKTAEIELIMLDLEASKLGGVETHADARKCADLFRQNRDRIDGVLVCLPNFGDEKGVADTLKLAELNVPVLVQGYPDDLGKLGAATRRDAFCGKVSVCNNLYQCGIPFSLTESHVISLNDERFQHDLNRFLGVCRVVKGLRGARLGAVGARPGAFNTVRYSEKILEANGISVTTIDLSEIIAGVDALDVSAAEVQTKLAEIQDYAPAPGVPSEKLVQMAKLGVVSWTRTRWMLRPFNVGPPCRRTRGLMCARL
jgi:L-fucose isomerase-like protein